MIAGYYVAHENFNETSIEKANHKIPDKIAENFANPCLVVVSIYVLVSNARRLKAFF